MNADDKEGVPKVSSARTVPVPNPEMVEFIKGFTQNWAAVIQKVVSGLVPVRKAIENFAQGIDLKAMAENTRSLLEAMQTFPEMTRNASVKAAARGWFVGPTIGMSVFRDVANAADGPTIDALFREHYLENLESIEDYSCSCFPMRAPILKAAFKAQRDKAFELCVPVFLVQAEGIARDQLGSEGELFTSSAEWIMKNRHMALKRMANGKTRWLRDIILEPLKAPLASGDSVKNWKSNPSSLNRHAILHGFDVEYGTELNSLKAISLIEYLTWVLRAPTGGTDDQGEASGTTTGSTVQPSS